MDPRPPPSRRSDRSVMSRRQSGLSFKSNRSSEDKGVSAKLKIDAKDLKENPKDKRDLRFGTSAKNPNTAISEVEPAERNQDESSTLPYLRSVQHRDYKGELITDPDSSNPARARMERPLDTIRSFEAAIDDSYSRRSQSSRQDGQDSSAMQTRRSSIAGYDPPHSRRYMSNNRDSYYGGGRPYHPRMTSAPNYPHSEYGVYPSQYYQGSRDTVYTGESVGSSEPWGNSTDPSSENSSLDRMQAARQMEYDMYGGGPPVRHDAIQEENGYDYQDYAPGPGYPASTGYAQSHPRHGNYPPYNPPYTGVPPRKYPSTGPYANADVPPPPVPAHGLSQSQEVPPRPPIKLGGPPGNPQQTLNPDPSRPGQLRKKPSDGGKRKSWLMRRFSKG